MVDTVIRPPVGLPLNSLPFPTKTLTAGAKSDKIPPAIPTPAVVPPPMKPVDEDSLDPGPIKATQIYPPGVKRTPMVVQPAPLTSILLLHVTS